MTARMINPLIMPVATKLPSISYFGTEEASWAREFGKTNRSPVEFSLAKILFDLDD